MYTMVSIRSNGHEMCQLGTKCKNLDHMVLKEANWVYTMDKIR